MDFEDIMKQARANEEQVKKGKGTKTLNLEPSRNNQKLRADIVKKQEDEKRRKQEEEVRLARIERAKLARMEAAMAEHERKIVEDEEKQARLDQMHKEAQERKAKMEAEHQAKRDSERAEQDMKKVEERERKADERSRKAAERERAVEGRRRQGGALDRDETNENDIFKRRQREIDEKRERRERKRRKEEKLKKKEIDKERRLAKIREDARKVAMSFSKLNAGTSNPPAPPATSKKHASSPSTGLMDLEEATQFQHKRAESSSSSEEEDLSSRSRGPRRRISSHTSGSTAKKNSSEEEKEERDSTSGPDMSSEEEEELTNKSYVEIESPAKNHNPVKTPVKKQSPVKHVSPARKDATEVKRRDAVKHMEIEASNENKMSGCITETISSKPKVSDIIGGLVDTKKLTNALQQFIKYPDCQTADISDAEYDSHEEGAEKPPSKLETSQSVVTSPTQTLYSELRQESVTSQSATTSYTETDNSAPGVVEIQFKSPRSIRKRLSSECRYSPLDTALSESLNSQTINSPSQNSPTLNSPTLTSQPRHSQTLNSSKLTPARGVFREPLPSDSPFYTPRSIQGGCTPLVSYFPSTIPTRYSPENFTGIKDTLEYTPSVPSGSYTPGPTTYMQDISYTPTRETLTSETQATECFTPTYEAVLDPAHYTPSPNDRNKSDKITCLGDVSSSKDDIESDNVKTSECGVVPGAASEASVLVDNTNVPTPESVYEGVISEPAEGFASPCTLQSETVFSSQRSDSPQADSRYSSATLRFQTLTSPSGPIAPCTATPPDVITSPPYHESLVSETVSASPSMATPSFDNFCYSPIRTDELNILHNNPGSVDKIESLNKDRVCSNLQVKTSIIQSEVNDPSHDADESMYSPGAVHSKVHYSPGPVQYIPEHLSNEVQEVCYTPAKTAISDKLAGEMTPHETEIICEMTPSRPETDSVQMTPHETDSVQMTPHETELDCGIGEPMTPNPKELTPNETEINCGRSESEASDIDSGADSELMKSKKRHLSETSDEADIPSAMTKEDRKSTSKEKKSLEELFGDESDDSDKEKKNTGQHPDEESEEESSIQTSQDRRNKLKELARKKNKGYSSDSMSDYDHEEHEPPSPDQPKSFEDLLALANRKDQENRKELEMRKQKEVTAEERKKERETRRKELQLAFDKKKKEVELKLLEREKRVAEEKLKHRIPKITSSSTGKMSEKKSPKETSKHPDKHTDKLVNKHSDKYTDKHPDKNTDKHSDKYSEIKGDNGDIKFKSNRGSSEHPNKSNSGSSEHLNKSNSGSSEHPNKRKRLSGPIKPEKDGSGSFEDLMRLAHENSKKNTFGSSIRKPEDVVREKNKKEIEKKREHLEYLNFKPCVPTFKPQKSAPPKPPPHPPLATKNQSSKEERIKSHHQEHRKEEHRKEERRSSNSRERSESRRHKDEIRKPDKKAKRLHANPYMDDDLDEFVVGDGEDVDYSKAIRNMFGYDKRKYTDADDDCRGMEADFRSIQKEEARSARLARQEDADELKKIQAEEERERKRKLKR